MIAAGYPISSVFIDILRRCLWCAIELAPRLCEPQLWALNNCCWATTASVRISITMAKRSNPAGLRNRNGYRKWVRKSSKKNERIRLAPSNWTRIVREREREKEKRRKWKQTKPREIHVSLTNCLLLVSYSRSPRNAKPFYYCTPAMAKPLVTSAASAKPLVTTPASAKPFVNVPSSNSLLLPKRALNPLLLTPRALDPLLLPLEH